MNICTNQNKTLMKQIQNSQKSIEKSMTAYGFLKSQEKNPRTKGLETFAKSFFRLAYGFKKSIGNL